ncbi:MAG: glycosyltransferase, partial [Verrucomicrobiota bacterium]|nr:glycosyltransferase [Verrucomicrobiota bacterium]
MNQVAKYLDVTLVTNARSPDCVMSQIAVGDGKILGQRYTDHELANKSYSLTLHPQLMRTLLSENPKVVICEGFLRWSLYALILKLLKPKTKLVMLYERTDHTERNAQVVRTIYRKFFLRHCDLVICAGRACKRYIQRLDSRVETTVGHMCADNERFRSRPRKTGIVKKIIYLGRLESRKGILTFLEAFVEVQPKHLTLEIFGEGDLRSSLEQLAVGRKNVKVRSYVANEALPDV